MPIIGSTEFKGIGFEYAEAEHPFFQKIVTENLRLLLKIKPLGPAIFEMIKTAKPAYRTHFPSDINVVFRPTISNVLYAPGIKSGQWSDDPHVLDDAAKYQLWRNFDPALAHKGPSMIPGMSAKTQVEAVSWNDGHETEKGEKSDGSVCWVYYSNREMIGEDGTWFIPHISIGHELIHCIHSLQGCMKFQLSEEEYATVGIKGYEKNTLTENELRKQAKCPPRTKYYSTD